MMRNENENHALIFEKSFSLCQSQRLIKKFGNLNQHQGEDELRHVPQKWFYFYTFWKTLERYVQHMFRWSMLIFRNDSRWGATKCRELPCSLELECKDKIEDQIWRSVE